LGYDYFVDDDAFRRFDLYDLEHGGKYVDKVTGKDLFAISFFEYRKPNAKNANHRFWQMYFQGLEIPRNAPGYIREAGELLRFTKLTNKERKMYVECEKRKADMDAYISTAWNDGREQERAKTLHSAAVLLRATGNWSFVFQACPDMTADEKNRVDEMAKTLSLDIAT
jgi:hypothetical protein